MARSLSPRRVSAPPRHARPKGTDKSRSTRRLGNRVSLEPLEDRTLMSIFTVVNTGDNGGVNPAPGAGTGTLARRSSTPSHTRGRRSASTSLVQASTRSRWRPGYRASLSRQPSTATPSRAPVRIRSPMAITRSCQSNSMVRTPRAPQLSIWWAQDVRCKGSSSTASTIPGFIQIIVRPTASFKATSSALIPRALKTWAIRSTVSTSRSVHPIFRLAVRRRQCATSFQETTAAASRRGTTPTSSCRAITSAPMPREQKSSPIQVMVST